MCRKSGSEIEPRDEVAVETYRSTLGKLGSKIGSAGTVDKSECCKYLDIAKSAPFRRRRRYSEQSSTRGGVTRIPSPRSERHLMLAVTWAGL